MKTRTNSSYIKSGLLLLFSSLLFLVACTEKDTSINPETSTVTDVDGKVYKTVKIGDQWWMAENLSVEKFNNGDPISFINANDLEGWSDTLLPLFCIYQDLSTAPGKLYNYAVVADNRNVAPAGWHVATDEDWKKLEAFIGMNSTEVQKTGWRGSQGDLIKKAGLNSWSQYNNVWATDEYLFGAMAGGCRLFNGKFSTPTGLTYNGFWWTRTDYQNGLAWYRYLDYKSSGIFRSHTYKSYGMSIRCVKD